MGLAKSELENTIIEEISYLRGQIEAKGSEPLLARDLISPSTSNIVNAIINGKRYDYDHATRKILANVFDQDKFVIPLTGYVANFTRLIIPLTKIFKDPKLEENFKLFDKFTNDEIKEHLHLDETSRANDSYDFISCYIQECKINKQSSVKREFNV